MHDHSTTSPRPFKSNLEHGFALDEETGAALVPLGGKKHPGLFALVDIADAGMVLPYSWSAGEVINRTDRRILYVRGRVDGRSVYLHRFLLGVNGRKNKVDHINHDGLDNRRANLRIVTHQQNIFNRRPNLNATSSFKGVSWYTRTGMWRAKIRVDGRTIALGEFRDEVEAALTYDKAARKYFGSYAYLNFPNEGEGS